jgi:trans-aconitate methyltransferase
MPSTTSPDVKRFDRWAATYDQSVLQRLYFGPVHSKMLDLLVQKGPKDAPSCIIDVGCGTGRLLRLASARWPEARLFGADPAENMVAEAAGLIQMPLLSLHRLSRFHFLTKPPILF